MSVKKIAKNLFVKFINLFLNKFGKKFVIVSNKLYGDRPRFAVKADLGYWYVGDIYNEADISNGIANNGYVEKNETELVIKIINYLLEKNDNIVVYDVGANTGYYGILTATVGKGRVKVFSFEPVKEHVDIMRESLKLNHLENKITVFPVALSNDDGEISIFLSGTGSTIVKGFMNVAEDNQRNVAVKKMDGLILANDMDLPDFIKIDIEGAEYNMLCGSKETIAKSRPIIFVEIIAHVQNGKRVFNNTQSTATLNLLRNDFGYAVFCLVDDKLKKVDADWNIEGAKMYLCLDNNKHRHLIKELCL